uniref:Uncharacterized protein n=1 Tax=Arundo donax TaxID=35708 RepID=A0A0A9G5Z4_ARUDO
MKKRSLCLGRSVNQIPIGALVLGDARPRRLKPVAEDAPRVSGDRRCRGREGSGPRLQSTLACRPDFWIHERRNKSITHASGSMGGDMEL